MQYLAWRVLARLHQSITISFLLVGHTKFAPDWCFGLLKQRYRRTFVSSLQDLEDVVEKSADVNTAQIVGTQEGQVVVSVYDWATFLGEHFRKVPQMTSYHHFTFTVSKPGFVTMKKFSDSESISFKLLSDIAWVPTPYQLPPPILPSGLSSTRQWYLYNQIREFCREGTQDLVCPEPLVPLEQEEIQERQNVTYEEDIEAPPTKQPRKCGICGVPGHTRRTCQKQI